VTAKTRHLISHDAPDIDGCIVLIESADPGFDWIFSHEILGLVTQYGGANSHMAIRCAEFGLPAAIGCGEQLFEALAKAPVIELNCAARKLSGH
jgi:phosphoenolpyruvate-protein kinase (PTS system EI component)